MEHKLENNFGNSEKNCSYPIGVITCFPPWPPCRINRRVPCHSLLHDWKRQTETCHHSCPLPTRCRRRHHQKTIQGCQTNGAAGPSVKGQSWPRFYPPCRHLPCCHLCTVTICHITRWVLHAFVVRITNGERVNQTSNQLIDGSALLLDELNVGGGLWDEAEEGLCGDLMGVCCGGCSQRKKDSSGVIYGRRRDWDGC